MYDFDHDNLITKEDVRMVLSYIPLKKKEDEENIIKNDDFSSYI